MTKSKMPLQEEKASHSLFRTYWGFILPNLADKLRLYPTERVKRQLHKEFKEYLRYNTTSNMTEEQMRIFLFEVLATCSTELGFFVRSNRNQPEDIEDMELSECWDYL